MDDFYVNLLDWNSDNILAVGLGQTVYLWNATNGFIVELMHVVDNNYITAIAWMGKGSSVQETCNSPLYN